MRQCPTVHCATTIVIHCNNDSAVAVSHCDTHRCPLPTLLLITIVPNHRPLRNYHCCPLQFCCHHATLGHLLMHRCSSTCRLVVTLSWLLLCHLLLHHSLSRQGLFLWVLLMRYPLICPSWLLCHLTTTTASQHAGLLSPCLSSLAPSCLPWLVVLLPFVAPLSLNELAGCHIASHCATLSFDPAGCCITPHCHLCCPTQMGPHPIIHCTVAAS